MVMHISLPKRVSVLVIALSTVEYSTRSVFGLKGLVVDLITGCWRYFVSLVGPRSRIPCLILLSFCPLSEIKIDGNRKTFF